MKVLDAAHGELKHPRKAVFGEKQKLVRLRLDLQRRIEEVRQRTAESRTDLKEDDAARLRQKIISKLGKCCENVVF